MLQQWIKEVARGKRGSKDLTYEECKKAAQAIVNGEASDAQTAAFLIAERMKEESPEELLAFVTAFQEASEKLQTSKATQDQIIDFSSPYTGRNKFAATIPVSILLAQFGIPAFLHSSDSLPPKYGISIKEIIKGLGVNVSLTTSELSQSIDKCNIAFAATDQFCPPLKAIQPIREDIGVRTILNTAEKLLNLANTKTIMLGAFHRTAINRMTPVFQNLGYEKVYIVQGIEGSEDLPIHRNSFIYKWSNDDSLESLIVKPSDYDLFEEEKQEKLTLEQQTSLITAILSGDQSDELTYYYKQVLFNTGIRYHLFGAASSIEEGISIAKDQLATGKGLEQLQMWKEGIVK